MSFWSNIDVERLTAAAWRFVLRVLRTTLATFVGLSLLLGWVYQGFLPLRLSEADFRPTFRASLEYALEIQLPPSMRFRKATSTHGAGDVGIYVHAAVPVADLPSLLQQLEANPRDDVFIPAEIHGQLFHTAVPEKGVLLTGRCRWGECQVMQAHENVHEVYFYTYNKQGQGDRLDALYKEFL